MLSQSAATCRQTPAQNRRILNHYTPKDLHSQDYSRAQNYTGRRAMCIEFAICISDTTLGCSNSTPHVDHLPFTISETCLARHRASVVHIDPQPRDARARWHSTM